MKLFAAPLVVGVLRQAHHSDQLQCPIAFAQALPRPLSINDRVAKRSPVRCAYLATVVEISICVVVAFGTRSQRSLRCMEVCSAMFCMTVDATYSSCGVRFSYRSDKSLRVVTLRAVLFHSSRKRMARRAGVPIGFSGDGGEDT